MDFLTILGLIFGAYLLWLVIALIIEIILIVLLIKFAKKHPGLTFGIFLFMIIGGLLLDGTIAIGNIPGIIIGTTSILTAIVGLAISWNKVKKAFKKKRR